LDFGGSRTAKAVGAKHNKPTTASHHFQFLLFITTTPFEQRSALLLVDSFRRRLAAGLFKTAHFLKKMRW
jgi:hypothetical protein